MKMKFGSIILSLSLLFILAVSAYAAEQIETPEPETANAQTQDLDQAESADSARASSTYYRITENNVRLRSGPGTKYSTYGYVQKGEVFVRYGPAMVAGTDRVYADGYYWIQGTMDNGANYGVEGWVAEIYLRDMY